MDVHEPVCKPLIVCGLEKSYNKFKLVFFFKLHVVLFYLGKLNKPLKPEIIMTSMSMMSGRKVLTTFVQGTNKHKQWQKNGCCFNAGSIRALKQERKLTDMNMYHTTHTQTHPNAHRERERQRNIAGDSNPKIQQSKIHPITRKPGGPVIPVTTILGTSRIVPNDAVLRWPRLYRGRAAKTHTHTHRAAYTTSMQTKTDCRPNAWLLTWATNMHILQCNVQNKHAPCQVQEQQSSIAVECTGNAI